MPNQKLQSRLLLLLMPLALLTLVSYAFDLRIYHDIPLDLQSDLLSLSRLFIPSLFALGAAMLIPTSSRSLQLVAVISSYYLLAIFCLKNLPGLFNQPTAWILSSLTSTLVLLPDLDLGHDRRARTPLITIAEILLAFMMPAISLLILSIIIECLGGFIAATFTQNLISTPFSFVIVPIYSLIQALGFNTLLNTIFSFQYNNQYSDAILNSIAIGNLFVLPTTLLTSALFANRKISPFLFFFALIVILTSHNGACISIELSILLLFFQGCFFAFSLSSIMVFFVCIYYKLPALTNFFMLYQPDLSIRYIRFLNLEHYYYPVLIFAIVSGCLTQIIFIYFYKFKYIRSYQNQRLSGGKIKLNRQSSPDLYVITLLKVFGSLSNLRSVIRQGRICYIKVNDPNLVSMAQLNKICMRKPRYERNRNVYILDIGDNCAIITEKLSKMIAEISESADNYIPLSQEFIIR